MPSGARLHDALHDGYRHGERARAAQPRAGGLLAAARPAVLGHGRPSQRRPMIRFSKVLRDYWGRAGPASVTQDKKEIYNTGNAKEEACFELAPSRRALWRQAHQVRGSH